VIPGKRSPIRLRTFHARVSAVGSATGGRRGELTREEAEERARSQRHDRTPTTHYPMRRDLRDVGGRKFVTPVHDQGECAACVAFGSLATLEATIQYQRHDPALGLDFSEAHLFHCTPGCLKCAFG
jgi:hypothetical protein